MVLKHSDNLSCTLQHKSMSAMEGHEIAVMTIATLKSLCNDTSFDLLWDKVNLMASKLNVDEPQLPRIRKKPKRFNDGKSDGDFHADPKALYRQGYYEVIDFIIAAIQERFDQPGYKKYQQLEVLLIKAMKQKKLEDDLNGICSLYGDDFKNGLLEAQLITFELHYQQVLKEKNEPLKNDMSIFDVKDYFTSLSQGQQSLLSEVKKVLQLVLVMPATNATSERSFSAL